MNQKVNIAVIGTGRMGSVHVANLVRHIPQANLAAICDIRLEVAQALAQDLGISRVEQNYYELLADPSIEAVLIATSTNTHARIIQDAAAAGKHIFCEKPLALELEDVDQALAAVENAHVKLQVGFNRRFDKSFQKVHKIVESGQIGNPCILRITNRDPELPAMEFLRVSGGMFLDMSIHDFDMARFQVGEVEEVYAIGNVLIEPGLNDFGDLDTTIITLKFANGAIGAIDNSRQAVYGYDQRLEVFCTEGTAQADNETETTIRKGNRDGFLAAKLPYFFMQRYAPCYIEEVRTFIECVRDDRPTPVTGRDGRMAVVIGHAAWKSFHEQRPVKITEFDA
ncbi:MAG: inositol 2-dehydrogenase [Chloroflexi bacterium]|jgi:myo-inositol 2-dehydrogenase/D-chiro-inositol 1-dehydrogenase|nr:inositol 2-dehydrogenase [Chloroflexota bacterium]